MEKKIEWDKKYELGVPLIDSQHKRIVELAGDLHDALSGDPERYKGNLEGILKALCDYTDYHFAAEERLIEKHGYAGIAAHKLAHQSFIMELNNQMSKLYGASGGHGSDLPKCDASCSRCQNAPSCPLTSAGFRFYEYVLSWLFTHIAKADKLWAVSLEKKGVDLQSVLEKSL